MSVKVSSVPSVIAGGRYRLVLHTAGALGFDAFLAFAERSSTVTRADALAVLERAATWVVACAAEGRECELGPLGRSRLGLKGVFDQRPERILDEDVRLTVSWVFPPKLREEVRTAGGRLSRDQVQSRPADPQIDAVRGFIGGLNQWQDGAYQAGGALELIGHRLKFNRARVDEGVFLAAMDGTEPYHRVQQYLQIFPRKVVCVIPPELAGSGGLRVELRKRIKLDVGVPRSDRYADAIQEAESRAVAASEIAALDGDKPV